MIVFLLNCYLVALFLLVYFKVVPFNVFWKCSPFLVMLLLLVGLFVPMGWGAPSGPALVVRQSVQIASEVAGEVIEVPVQANVPLKANDVLFKIDPAPYEAQVRALKAQLKFQKLRLAQMQDLQSKGTGRAFDVEERQAEVDRLRAQLEGAEWNLAKTVVRAPADGYVTNLALRKGAHVAATPVMAFIDTSETIIGVEVPQIYARYLAPGQEAEITFKFAPGEIFAGRVTAVLQAVSAGQVQTSGLAVETKQIESAPFLVRVALDDAEFASRLPAGSTGDAAIFTNHVKPTHLIRKVLLRQVAILNYVNPF